MKNELTLFQLAQEYRAITEVLMDSGCDPQTLADTLEGESWELTLKAQNYGMVIRNLEASAAAIKEAEAQMAARRKAIESRCTMLLDRLKQGMELAGVSRLDSPYFAISIQKNPPAVEILDERQIPQAYMRQPDTPPPAPDKNAIAAAIKKGKEVPGAKLTQGTKLVIK
jgi:hypothetical protein